MNTQPPTFTGVSKTATTSKQPRTSVDRTALSLRHSGNLTACAHDCYSTETICHSAIDTLLASVPAQTFRFFRPDCPRMPPPVSKTSTVKRMVYADDVLVCLDDSGELGHLT
ncbi:hypothetical protein CU097_006421 [Rhizopus azygosporus]|uniref:Uncharacterized protein n=1 Tax=Rhizopus azygosporus TaxID=86630 RepID=A0A367K1I6_RHIAZ|nr:hypothetical protein CU097_006421 [Rhizopus azygosporus]